jgi:hypothetical protein
MVSYAHDLVDQLSASPQSDVNSDCSSPIEGLQPTRGKDREYERLGIDLPTLFNELAIEAPLAA